MGSWWSSSYKVTLVYPDSNSWVGVTYNDPIYIYHHSGDYLVTAKQDERHYQLHQTRKLAEANKAALELKERVGEFVRVVHISDATELERVLQHTSKNPDNNLLQTVCQLDMFNKFSDGLSGLKDMVNSPTMGRNQIALHIAVKSNTAFAVNQLLNAGGDPLLKDEIGNTPAHTAAFCGASVALQTILTHESVSRIKEEILTSVNNEGDTPLHLACKAPQVSCLELLLEHGADVHTANTEGLLPIQCAVLSEHADVKCVDALLEHNMHLVKVEDADGNGLLHHAKGTKVVACLMYHKVDVKMLNNEGQTALHKAILELDNPLELVMALILNGVDVDLLDDHGNTALHVLVKLPAKKGSNREYLIKALVVLGSDLNYKNPTGQTVYEVAREAGCRSTMTLLNCVGADDTKYLNCKQYPPIEQEIREAALSDTAPRKRPNWNDNHAALLALDGGGIRGLVLIQMLFDIERRANLSITELFDWIGGTSTGAMLTLGTVFSKMTLRDCQKLYFNLKEEVFKGSRPYNTEILENFLIMQYTEDAVMSGVKFPRCLVPATIADCRPCKLHVFKNYGFRSEHSCAAPHQQKVWEAARASSAAPTYFTPHKRFVDGGLMANNPTITMLTELHECNQDPGKLGIGEVSGYGDSANPVSFTEGLMRAVVGDEFSKTDDDGSLGGYIESRPVDNNNVIVKDIKEEPTKPYIVVSLGTGLAPEVMVKDYNVSKIDGALGAGKFIMGIKEFVETMVEQVAGTDGAVVMGAKAWCESIGCYYFRVQPQLSYNMKLDETENKALVECLWDVQCYVYQRREHFSKMTDLLMSAFYDTS